MCPTQMLMADEMLMNFSLHVKKLCYRYEITSSFAQKKTSYRGSSSSRRTSDTTLAKTDNKEKSESSANTKTSTNNEVKEDEAYLATASLARLVSLVDHSRGQLFKANLSFNLSCWAREIGVCLDCLTNYHIICSVQVQKARTGIFGE